MVKVHKKWAEIPAEIEQSQLYTDSHWCSLVVRLDLPVFHVIIWDYIYSFTTTAATSGCGLARLPPMRQSYFLFEGRLPHTCMLFVCFSVLSDSHGNGWTTVGKQVLSRTVRMCAFCDVTYRGVFTMSTWGLNSKLTKVSQNECKRQILSAPSSILASQQCALALSWLLFHHRCLRFHCSEFESNSRGFFSPWPLDL